MSTIKQAKALWLYDGIVADGYTLVDGKITKKIPVSYIPTVTDFERSVYKGFTRRGGNMVLLVAN